MSTSKFGLALLGVLAVLIGALYVFRDDAPQDPMAAVQALTEGRPGRLSLMGNERIFIGGYRRGRTRVEAYTGLKDKITFGQPRIAYRSPVFLSIAVPITVKDTGGFPAQVFFNFHHDGEIWHWVGGSHPDLTYWTAKELHRFLNASDADLKRDAEREIPGITEQLDPEQMRESIRLISSEDNLRNFLNENRADWDKLAKNFLAQNIPELDTQNLSSSANDPQKPDGNTNHLRALAVEAEMTGALSLRRVNKGAMIRISMARPKEPKAGVFLWFAGETDQTTFDGNIVRSDLETLEGISDFGNGWMLIFVQPKL